MPDYRLKVNDYDTHTYPARIFSNVDFPAPEGPIIAVNSPDLNFPLIDFSSCLQPVTIFFL